MQSKLGLDSQKISHAKQIAKNIAGDGIHIIGHVTSPGQGCYLVTPDGAELRLRAQGWPDQAEE